MGYMKRMSEEAERIKRRRPKRLTGGSVGVEASTMEGIEKHFPLEFHMRVMDPALKAAADVVVKEYRKNLDPHRSKRERDYYRTNDSGNSYVETVAPRDKWSEKIKNERSYRADIDLRRAVGQRRILFRRNGTLLRMVGIKRPHGSHANLIEYGANVNLWGTGVTYRMTPFAPLRRAADESKGAQQAAVRRTVVQKQIDLFHGGDPIAAAIAVGQ